MRALRVFSFLFLAGTFAACGGGVGGDDVSSATVSGTILDSRGDPVSGATVTITSDPVVTTTDAAGRFEVSVALGDHSLTVVKHPDTICELGFSIPDESPVDLGDLAPTGPYFPWYADGDGDGYGDSDQPVNSESKPVGSYTTDDSDCDDGDIDVNPGVVEVCNGADDDCDGEADDGLPTQVYYADSDADSYGDPGSAQASCSQPSGYVMDDSDCDDGNDEVKPGAAETCDGVDNDCSDTTADGSGETWFGSSCDGDDSDQCLEGTYGCADGLQVCSDTTGDNLETCNGSDDDCDGATDEGISGSPLERETVCGTGECSGNAGVETCIDGVYANDTCDPLAGAAADDVLCNGLDDDCDGFTDEDFLSSPTTCGTGPCASSGTLQCIDGSEVDSCTAGSGAANDATCDGVDDDCDGLTDEDYAAVATSCGVGECASAGVTACVEGVESNTCTPGDPVEEICNGLDDDCDGVADEDAGGFPLARGTSCGVGECAGNSGEETCIDGVYADDTCDPLAGAAADDSVCNGLDDDCDGSTDEDYISTATACGTGECTAAGQSACLDGVESNNCTPGAPSAEICNGLDDNCDGTIDDGVIPTWYRDLDADGYGDPAWPQDDCDQPHLYVADNTDCDDGDPDINPETVWYADNDSDQWPTSTAPVNQCASPGTGYVADHTFAIFDCDDTTGTLSPGNLEIQGNSIDDDCNPATPDNLTSYSMADLAGTWTIVGVNAGDYASSQWIGWVDGRITFDSKGQYTDYSLTYDDGTVDKTPSFTQLWVNPDGTITTMQAPEMHGALSQDKDTVVATFSDEEGGYTMYLLQKQAVAVTLDDFAGLWHAADIAAGDTPGFNGWRRGTFNVQPGGTALINHSDSSGYNENGWVNTGLDQNGALADLEIVRYISPDGQMAVGRGEYRGGFILTTYIRSGGAFLPGNLEGDWSFHVLSSGDAPQINGWGHGMLNFDSGGSGLVNFQAWSDPSAVIDLGTLSMDEAGAIASDLLTDFVGHLSRDKDTIIATFTNDSGGASMLVALRRDQPFLGIVPEEHNSVSAVIGSAGGSLPQAISDGGVVYDLFIPPYALGDSELELTVKMTPLSALDGLPVSGSFLGAVQLAPEGLQLVEPAALVVTAPGIIDLADAVSYVYEGSGDDFHFVPLLPGFLGTGAGHTSVLVPIEHFSGGGFTTATLPDMTDLLSELSSTPSAQAEFYRTRIAWWIKEMISNGILDFSDPELSDPYLIHIRGVLNDWFLNFIIPETEASESIEELRRSVQEYIRWKTYIQNLAQEYRIFCIPNPNTGQCPGDSELVRSGADNEMHIAVYDRIDAVLFPLDRECSDITSCQPGYPCPPGATHNMCAGAYYWDMAQPWIYFQVQIDNFMGWDDVGTLDEELTGFCNGIDNELPQIIKVFPPKMQGVEIGEQTDLPFTGQYATFRAMRGGDGPSEITLWTSDWEDVAGIGSSGYATGVNPGVTAIRGWDKNKCLDDTAAVIVGDPWMGTWNISISSRPIDTCSPIPLMADPSTVHMRLNGNQVIWTDQDQGYFYQMTGNLDPEELFEVEISGDSLPEFLQQNCTLKMDTGAFIKGECSYRDYDNSWNGNVCSGTWKFSATKTVVIVPSE